MKKYSLYWGDFHVNVVGYTTKEKREANLKLVEGIFKNAKGYIDFLPVAYYAFYGNKKNGLQIESHDHDPSFDRHWEVIRDVVKGHDEPGIFATFMGYEWHGDRERFGDHNVFYCDHDKAVLTGVETLPELYKVLEKNDGIAIPHHTAYKIGERGKDWDYFDENLSPLAEIFSGHGSSEGSLTPVGLESNLSMGPRIQGSSMQAGLKRGHHFGIIASSDTSYPMAGTWGRGLAAVYAKDLTRESIWDAIKNRRTYGVTGDRINLEYSLNDHIMGSIIEQPANSAKISVNVCGSSAIDRIEVIKNCRVAYTYCHQGSWEDKVSEGQIKFKHRFTVGWGPNDFGDLERKWTGNYEIEDGKILSVEPCFTTANQKYSYSDNTCEFSLITEHRHKDGYALNRGTMQALVIEGEASSLDKRIIINIEGKRLVYIIRELLEQTYVEPFIEESRERIKEVFDLSTDEVGNPDVFYHHSYKIKIHRLIPEQGYTAAFQWEDTNLKVDENNYYIRVSQANRQYAWSSPIWVKGK